MLNNNYVIMKVFYYANSYQGASNNDTRTNNVNNNKETSQHIWEAIIYIIRT